MTAITLFNTVLSHADLSQVVVPNRKIVGEILHNYGQLRQLDISVGVAYNTDLNKAMATIADVLRTNDRILQDPMPVIAASVLTDSSINLAVKPWVDVKDYGIAHGEVTKGIVEAFRLGAIAIPFPQREIRMLA